jgi:hypothetical protein
MSNANLARQSTAFPGIRTVQVLMESAAAICHPGQDILIHTACFLLQTNVLIKSLHPAVKDIRINIVNIRFVSFANFQSSPLGE